MVAALFTTEFRVRLSAVGSTVRTGPANTLTIHNNWPCIMASMPHC